MKKLLFSLIIICSCLASFAQTPIVFDRMFVSSDGSLVLWLKKTNDTIFWQSTKGLFKFNGGVMADSLRLGEKWFKTAPVTQQQIASQIHDSINNFVRTESDPVFIASPSGSITSGLISNWNSAYNLSHYHSNLLLLQNIKASDTTRWAQADTSAEWTARTIYVSMTTDPQTPGSDITGDGSSSKPYATINKALSTIKSVANSVVTIQLDSGSFNYTYKDKVLTERIVTSSVVSYNNSPIIISGQYVKESTSFTLQATPFFGYYKIVGYSFATNEIKDKFLGTASAPTYPIESNYSDTLVTSVNISSNNNLYRLNSTVNFEASTYILAFSDLVKLQYIKGNFTTSTAIMNILAQSCILSNSTTSTNFTLFGTTLLRTKVYLRSSSTTSAGGVYANSNTFISFCVLDNNNTRKTTGVGLRITGSPSVYSSVISGFSTAIFQASSHAGEAKSIPTFLTIKDCGTAISNYGTPSVAITMDVEYFIVRNTNYIFNTTSALTPIRFSVSNYQGGPLLGIFTPTSLYKSFVDPSLGGYIKGLGVFTEYQQNETSSLSNNATDSISIGDKTYNRSIEIKYIIARGSNYRTGTIKVLNTGTSLLFDPGEYIETGDVGVLINGVYYSGNFIKLKWTTTDTGVNASMQWDAVRQNY